MSLLVVGATKVAKGRRNVADQESNEQITRTVLKQHGFGLS